MHRVVTAGAVLLVLAAGCTADPDPGAADGPAAAPSSGPPAATSPPPPSPSPSVASPSRPSDPPTARARKPHPVSLPALQAREYDGHRLRLGDVLVTTDAYTQHAVTYRGDGLTISGVMNLPHGKGPFPVLVLAHGYIDPDVYVTGQGLRREQDWLARRGYAVLHVDYRNHAGSERDPRADVELRLGYTVDVVNAVHAVRTSRLRRLDPERVGLLGRSMGGGVVLNVLTVAPGLVDAAVVYASVSSRAEDNFDRWIRSDPARSGLARRIVASYGAPERNRRFWREVSPRTYLDRVTEPVLLHHGTADDTCPLRWSRQTQRALQRAGADSRLEVYPGEPHAFIADWPLSMQRTTRFFDRHL